MNQAAQSITDLLCPGKKFACFLLRAFRFDHRKPQTPISLPDDVTIYPALGFPIAGHWADWLGELRVDELKGEHVAILAATHATNPGVIDAQTLVLEKLVERAYRALLFVAVPYPGFEESPIICGEHERDAIQIRRWSAQRIAGSIVDMPIDPDRGFEVAAVYEGLQELDRASEQKNGRFSRFIRGYWAWMTGMLDANASGRLHQHCRALEALFAPDKGRSTKKFKSRGELCGTTNQGAIHDVLGDIYELRSAVEHMRDWRDAVGFEDLPRADALLKAHFRTYQAELLSRDFYGKLLTKQSLRQSFESDDAIRTFWADPTAAMAVLGSPLCLDLSHETEEWIEGVIRRI